MAVFKTCVRNQRRDGFWSVYIRVTHHRKVGYIKTDKVVDGRGLAKKTMEVRDPFVLRYCSERITDYVDRLNRVDTETWDVSEVIDFLQRGTDDVCFSDYAREYHQKMMNRGQSRNAENYKLAYQHLERYAGTNKVMFSHLTSLFINKWIESLGDTARAKEMYPVCVRQIFKQALLDYNDYDNGLIRIKTNPWAKVRIPKSDTPEKRAITLSRCREFFAAPVKQDVMLKYTKQEYSRDVAMMIICLAGINTVDIFNLRKKDYYGGIIHYERAKTRKGRADNAYIEMRVPGIIQPLFDKYANTNGIRNDEGEELLFNFREHISSSDSFNANVNGGIREICATLGIPKDEWYSTYTFRHTWGTVAQNDLGCSLDDIALAMNHSGGHAVTRGYIKMDFSRAWEINEQVVELIFFSDKESSRVVEREREKAMHISPKYLVQASAWYKGKMLCEVEDIGFNNKDEVIAELAKRLPPEIPERAMVQFRVRAKDKDQTAIYERMKGKGF